MKIEFYNTGTRSRLNVLMAALSGIAVVLLLFRTVGIEHDSILYFGQSLLYYQPDIFSKDIFLAHGGGQSNYSIFPWLSGKLLNWIEPTPFFMWGTLIGLLLFTVSSWFLLKIILPVEKRYIPWMAILCFPTGYGYTRVFSYNEQFLALRTLSESFCLLSIIFIIRNRFAAAFSLIILSGTLHPLQTLLALPVIWLKLVGENKKWLHVLWLTIPIVAMALIGIRPFNGLFHQADPFWLMTMKLSPQLFITLWQSKDFINLTFDLFILALAWKYLAPSFSLWCRAALIALLLGITGNLILVDWLNLVLPAGLQLWRVHWLAHWFAMASLGLFLLEHWRKQQWPQAVLLMLIALLAWKEDNWGWLGAAAIYLGWRPWLINESRTRLEPLFGMLFGLVIGLLFIKHITPHWNLFMMMGYNLELKPIDFEILKFPVFTFGLIALGINLWKRFPTYGAGTLSIVLISFLTWGVLKWDSRDEVRRYMDLLYQQNHIFGIAIPEGYQVHWNIKNPVYSWYILGRPQYYSYLQVAGQVFNRATAVDGYDRWLRIIDMEDEIEECFKNFDQKPFCHISDVSLYKLCKPAPTPVDPNPPDYFILTFNQQYQHLGWWPVYDTYTGKLLYSSFIYSCEAIMEQLPVEALEKELENNDKEKEALEDLLEE